MTYELPIERGKIREFARATGATDPAYEGSDAVVPPTFLTTARLAWEPEAESVLPTLGFDMRRVLHADEEYVFHGPLPRAGQMLTVTTRLGQQFEKEGRRGGVMRFAVIVNEFRDEAGNLVAEQRSTAVETAKPAQEGRDG